MPSNPTRREVLTGAAAVAAAAALPVVSEPDLGVFEWLEQVELDAMKRFPLKAFAPIHSIYPEGSWQYHDHHAAQCVAQAFSSRRE